MNFNGILVMVVVTVSAIIIGVSAKIIAKRVTNRMSALSVFRLFTNQLLIVTPRILRAN